MNRFRFNRASWVKAFLVLGTVANGFLFANIAHATLLDSGADVGEHCHKQHPNSTPYQEVCVKTLCHLRPTGAMAEACRDKADDAINDIIAGR